MRDDARWVAYLLVCADETLYAGVTVDLDARVAMHNAGRGAKYTRGRGPVRVLWCSEALSRSVALRMERAIKALPRRKKLLLARGEMELVLSDDELVAPEETPTG